MSAEPLEPDNPARWITTVHPDGTTTSRELTPEEAARMDAEFEKKFDPVTFESRAIQRMRNEGNAHQEILALLRQFGPSESPPARVPMTERLLAVVTEDTAQSIWNRAVDRFNRKRRWASERKKGPWLIPLDDVT